MRQFDDSIKLMSLLAAMVLLVGVADVQGQTVDAGWSAFVIRVADDGTSEPPVIQNDDETPDALEFIILKSGQKAGLGTDLINGARVDQISTLHIDRLDDVENSGSLYGPYFNIWITDGSGNYAVIANEPSNPAWAGSRWDVPDWDFLRTKVAKVYETPGWNTGTSWVHNHVGHAGPFTFEDMADLIIAPPSAAYINDPNNGVGSGAPDDIVDSTARGFNWIFGDTLANYISGGDGFIVDNYFATADFPVHNVTQNTYFGAIQPAIDAANAGDTITVAAGTYEEQLHITKDNLSLEGAGTDDVTVLSLVDLPLSYTTSASNYPIVFIDGCTGVTVSGLTVDGAGRGNDNYRFQGVAFWNAGGSLVDVDVVNVMDTPFSGAQHGIGVYAFNDTNGPYTVNLTRVQVEGYQKGGIALNGTGLTGNVADCTTIGIGPTGTTAQNGIQFYGTAGGSITGSSVSDNIYTGSGWAGSGILLIEAGTLQIEDTQVSNGDPAVYCQDSQALVDGLSIANNHVDSGNGFYVGLDTGVAKSHEGDLLPEHEPSPFGDADLAKQGTRGTSSVTITNSEFIGQTTGYGLAASNYVAADLIDIDLSTTEISNWGWGIVAFGSGGEIAIEASGNGIFGNGNCFYAHPDLTTLQNASGNYWGETDPAVLASGTLNGAIDYTPWLVGGTATAPGYVGDYSELWVDDDSPQSGASGRMLEAVGLVSNGTIRVAPGEYVGTEQIVVTGNIQVLGDPIDPPRLRPGFNTGSSGDSRGWWLVQDPNTLVVRDLILDGDGYNVYHGFRVTGGIEASDCVFENIIHPGYQGIALAAFGNIPAVISGCEFENIGRVGALLWADATVQDCTYTGKGAGDHLDYLLDIGGGASVIMTGCEVTNNLGVASSDGSTSAAVLAATFYGAGTSLVATDNKLTGNTAGVAVGYDENDATIASINFNDLSGNEWGITNSSTNIVDGLHNWWGDVTGPLHPDDNPGGLGSKVDDYILFDPYLSGVIYSSPDPLDLNIANPSDTVTVSYLGGYGPVYGYSIDVQWDNSVATASGVPPLAFSRPDSGPFATAEPFIVQQLAPGHVRVDAGIGGTEPGINSGDLFKAVFTAASDGDVPISITVNNIADYASPPQTNVPADDGQLRVDLAAPVVAAVLITNTTLSSTEWVKNGDTIVVTATVTDNGTLASVTCNLTGFGGGAAVAPDAAPVGDVYTWTFTVGTTTPADGPVSATVTAVDNLGNSASAADDITADNTAPQALTGLVALPSHKLDGTTHSNQIILNWDDPNSLDTNFDRVEFRYVVEGNYPAYDTGTPGSPTLPAAPTAIDQGAAAFSASGTDHAWSGMARELYALAAFVVDKAGNVSVQDGTSDVAYATSYYLGDVYPTDDLGDGQVAVLDINRLGEAYGLTSSDGTSFTDFDDCNVGPTLDYTRFGIPAPDGVIGFQDLMIFAMNFGEVSATAKASGAVGTPIFAWSPVDERTWALELVHECAGLKGINVTGDLPDGVTVTVGGGQMMGEQEAQVFLRNIDRNGLDAGMAVIGNGESFQGTGTLLMVTTSQPVADLQITIDARGLNNEELASEVQETTGVELPTVHALDQNFPNPFNPQTTIRFSLPQTEDVRLAIYDVSGRLVKTLVNEHREAGHHEVIWRGQDNSNRRVATGTYFYVIQAGDFHQVHKMSLIK